MPPPTSRLVGGFVARSPSNPSAVLQDPLAWNQLWLDARERLAAGRDVSFNRWSDQGPHCA